MLPFPMQLGSDGARWQGWASAARTQVRWPRRMTRDEPPAPPPAQGQLLQPGPTLARAVGPQAENAFAQVIMLQHPPAPHTAFDAHPLVEQKLLPLESIQQSYEPEQVTEPLHPWYGAPSFGTHTLTAAVTPIPSEPNGAHAGLPVMFTQSAAVAQRAAPARAIGRQAP